MVTASGVNEDGNIVGSVGWRKTEGPSYCKVDKKRGTADAVKWIRTGVPPRQGWRYGRLGEDQDRNIADEDAAASETREG